MHQTPPHLQQQCLPLEPSAAELQAELLRIWQGRAYWRRRFKSLADLLADPWRCQVMTVCARQAWRARMKTQRAAHR